MNLFIFYGFLLLGLDMATMQDIMVLGSAPALVAPHEIPTNKCRYSKVYSKLQVRCWSMSLADIPQDLKSDIQILDASMNRLRALTNESLAPYKSLEYLYLGDNFIQTIADTAFANQRYLEVLDLTKNGCDYLPKGLFQLPYLRKVYLAENKLTDSVFMNDVTSPINYLQLSNNKFSKIPNIGSLPSLTYLNVSANSISAVSTEDLAPFCSLKVLDLSRNPWRIEGSGDQCDCRVFKAWLQVREIVFTPPFNCTNDENRHCDEVGFSNRTMEIYERCASVLRIKAETEKARSTWILVASCASAFIACVFLALFCVHRRNKKRRRKLKQQQRLAVNNANTELLNSNLQAENT